MKNLQNDDVKECERGHSLMYLLSPDSAPLPGFKEHYIEFQFIV